jgi:hypothetical protein
VCGGGLPQNWELLLRGRQLLGAGSGQGSANVLSGSESCLVSGQETCVGVRSVEGVDEGVDSGTVSAVGDEVGVQGCGGGSPGGEVSSVAVEGKVAVGGVVGVDEGVEVGVLDLIVVVADLGFGLLGNDLDLLGSDLLLLLLLNLDGSLLGNWDWCFVNVLSVESGGGLSVGRNVRSVENAESVNAGGVLDSVGLAVFSDVGVFSESVSVDVGLLPEDVSVLSGEGGSGAAVSGVESLLLQDLGILGVDLGAASSDGDSQNNLKQDLLFIIATY